MNPGKTREEQGKATYFLGFHGKKLGFSLGFLSVTNEIYEGFS
jgi:hypothetical protein